MEGAVPLATRREKEKEGERNEGTERKGEPVNSATSILASRDIHRAEGELIARQTARYAGTARLSLECVRGCEFV